MTETTTRGDTMTTFLLTVNTDNAAFDDPYELAKILYELSRRAQRDSIADETEGSIRDSNGNTCGEWSFLKTADGGPPEPFADMKAAGGSFQGVKRET